MKGTLSKVLNKLKNVDFDEGVTLDYVEAIFLKTYIEVLRDLLHQQRQEEQ